MKKSTIILIISLLIILSLCAVIYMQNNRLEALKSEHEAAVAALKNSKTNGDEAQLESMMESLVKSMDMEYSELYKYLKCPIYLGENKEQLKRVADEVIRLNLLGNAKILKIDDMAKMEDGRFRFQLLCYEPLNAEMLKFLKEDHVFFGFLKGYYVFVDFTGDEMKIELLVP